MDEEKGLTLELFSRDGKLTRQGMRDIGSALAKNYVTLSKERRQKLIDSVQAIIDDPQAHVSAKVRAMKLMREIDNDELTRAIQVVDIAIKVDAALADSEASTTETKNYATMTDAELDAEYARVMDKEKT